jgi:phosphopantothenoylcysteine decarboxylase/phosphopantothenate--cysteine ligase
MKIIVTCGPSYEPIDQARRLTNFSTGTLGTALTNALTAAGHEVICLKGVNATCADLILTERVEPFTTNDDLAERLERISLEEEVDVAFHAAALCDFKVDQVMSAGGEAISSPKFATRDGRLHLVLAPALKVLPRLRPLFPEALIVGWKYELAGSREDAFAKAWQQLVDCSTDACVLNGAAYGQGFAVCMADGGAMTFSTTEDLCAALIKMAEDARQLQVA